MPLKAQKTNSCKTLCQFIFRHQDLETQEYDFIECFWDIPSYQLIRGHVPETFNRFIFLCLYILTYKKSIWHKDFKTFTLPLFVQQTIKYFRIKADNFSWQVLPKVISQNSMRLTANLKTLLMTKMMTTRVREAATEYSFLPDECARLILFLSLQLKTSFQGY